MPFQPSAIGRLAPGSLDIPTAVQAVADAHDTAARDPGTSPNSEERSSHLVPSQRDAKRRRTVDGAVF